MPPPLLIDLAEIDLNQIVLTRSQIYDILPQKFEFSLLGGVVHLDPERRTIVAYADIGESDWWVRGHVPGRTLLPGVLMLEMAAHCCAILAKQIGHDGFIGFGGVDNCKFRETVTPPSRLYLLSAEGEYKSRRIVSNTQGVCNGRLVFEAQITGLTLR